MEKKHPRLMVVRGREPDAGKESIQTQQYLCLRL